MSTGAAPVQTISTLDIELEYYLPCMVAGVLSNDSKPEAKATTLIGQLLRREENPCYLKINELDDAFMRYAKLTLLNLNSDQPHPAFELTKAGVLGAVKRILVNSEDEEVLTNTCRAISYLCADANKIQHVIEAGFCQRLVELLKHPSPCVVIAAVVVVGNIVAGIIDVPTYEAQTAEFDIKEEFAWGISKATSGYNNIYIKGLVNWGCMKPLCKLLSCSDVRMVSVCLQGLENILKAGEELEKKYLEADDLNCFAELIEAGDLDKIENLETHDNHEISEKALQILETYFWLEEEEDDDDDYVFV